MQSTLTINGIPVGHDAPVFIIAEAGVNHDGSAEKARQLLVAAHEAGARCVKFQTFKAENLLAENAPKADYQLETTDPTESQMEMLRRLELKPDDYISLLKYAEEKDIVLLSTPYNIEDVDLLDDLGMPAFKLASMHLPEPSFLRYVAQKGKPMIVSTGMATMEEVEEGMAAIRSTGNDQVILLQCTTNYPALIEETNLLAMHTLREAFDVRVGYSDHTTTDTACIGAVALGACLIEKHFTLDRSAPGPDHAASVDPAGFEMLVQRIREAEAMRGDGRKIPTPAEKKNARGMRRSIYTRTHIEKGTVITPSMLTFKRPGTGLPPWHFDALMGEVALRDIPPNTPFSLDMVAQRATALV